MRIVMDGVASEVDRKDFANLHELIEGWGSDEEELDRVVLSVSLDGKTLEAGELEDPALVSLLGVDVVSIESCSSRQVALDSLSSSAEYADSVSIVIDQCVDHLRMGRIEEGNGLLVDLADSLMMLTSTISSGAEIMGEEGAEAAGLPGELTQWIRSIFEAQQQADWVRVSDYLEFEIAPMMDRWHAVLGSLVRRLGGESGGARSLHA